MTIVRRLSIVALAALLAGLAAGCAAGAATAPPSAVEPTPSAPSPDSGAPTDGGAVTLPPPREGGGGALPQPGMPELVVPRPGQQLVHPVAVSELAASVEGRTVILNARWWSGVEPCSVLDSVGVERDGSTITVSLFEGTSDPDAMCIAIAVEKVTVIDLGELDPGTYTVTADPGDAAAIVVEVP